MKKLLICFLITSACASLHAQQATPKPAANTAPATGASSSKPALPPGPLLKPVPDNTRCTVFLTGKAPAPEKAKSEEGPNAQQNPEAEENPNPGGNAKLGDKAKASTTTIIEEKVGNTAHMLTARSNGAREEKWTDGGLLATMRAGEKDTIFTTGGIDTVPMPTWVSAETFTDIKKQDDKSYLIFKTRAVPAGIEVVQDLEHQSQQQAVNEKLKVDVTAVILMPILACRLP